MVKTPKNTPQSPFDILISELIDSVGERSSIDLCFFGDTKTIESIPLRYRLIALGFAKNLSLEEVNERLSKNGCARLYARSLREASLIYAFRNGLSYETWKSLEADCADIRSTLLKESRIFSSPTLSLADIRKYVNDNSLRENELARTQHKTRSLSRALKEVPGDRDKFREFLLANLHSFCLVREKTRYYFCKYLMYYLETQKEKYLHVLKEGRDRNVEALEYLSTFRIRTALIRKKYSEQEADALIENSALSFAQLYSAFNDFYFDSLQTDWFGIQLELYGNLRNLDAQQAHELSTAIRHRNPSMKHLSDKDVISYYADLMEKKDEDDNKAHSRENKRMYYKKNRSGENFLRKVMRGELDLDRTTFLSFLLFFDNEARVPKEHKIDLFRFTEILRECGFPPLDTSTGFDRFLRGFMEMESREDKNDYLQTEADNLALSEKNFYLYKTYLASENSEKRWQDLMES